jgi:hypothetical protein
MHERPELKELEVRFIETWGGRMKGAGEKMRSIIVAIGIGVSAASCADAGAAAVAKGVGSIADGAAVEMTVYATPTCGCCGGWVDHMRDNGFDVRVVYQDDLTDVRLRYRLPAELTSCHMGVVEGFAVEGHVPASVVQRLLTERPEVLGIAAPGMPIGSPGMEVPDGTVQPFDVISYDVAGRLRVFQSIR